MVGKGLGPMHSIGREHSSWHLLDGVYLAAIGCVQLVLASVSCLVGVCFLLTYIERLLHNHSSTYYLPSCN